MFSDLENMIWSDIGESLGLSVNPMPAEIKMYQGMKTTHRCLSIRRRHGCQAKYLLSVLYCYFLNTCHICIHMHRLIPCSGRAHCMNIEFRVNHFIILICFVTLGGIPLPLYATSIILHFMHGLIAMLPDMVFEY